MIHKYPHNPEDGLDPTCERCRTMSVASLGSGWCERATGMSPQELRSWLETCPRWVWDAVLDSSALKAQYITETEVAARGSV